MLQKIPHVKAIAVRTPEEMANVDGIILPGGESTTIGNIATRWGLLDPLRNWTAQKRPIFGTCAGLILLSDEVSVQKIGGQPLIGGLNIAVERNYYGSQLGSFEAVVQAPILDEVHPGLGKESRAVFIRAPGILRLQSQNVNVLAEIDPKQTSLKFQSTKKDLEKLIPVAVRQDNILATTFHPELTSDLRWHELFIQMVRDYKSTISAAEQTVSSL